MRGVKFFYHFGVLGCVVMIEKLYPKGTSYGRTTKQMKSFYAAIKDQRLGRRKFSDNGK
jgi:hypothetical protein